MQFQDWLHSILVLTISVWAQEKLNLLAVSGTPVCLDTLTVPRKLAVDCRTGQSRPLVHHRHPLVLLLLIVCHKLTFWLHSKNKMGNSMTHRSKIIFGFLRRALRRTGGLVVFTWLSELCLFVVVPSAAEVFMFRSAFSDDVCHRDELDASPPLPKSTPGVPSSMLPLDSSAIDGVPPGSSTSFPNRSPKALSPRVSSEFDVFPLSSFPLSLVTSSNLSPSKSSSKSRFNSSPNQFCTGNGPS